LAWVTSVLRSGGEELLKVEVGVVARRGRRSFRRRSQKILDASVDFELTTNTSSTSLLGMTAAILSKTLSWPLPTPRPVIG
jgi:hypothetical protein